jgi:hypothetical protein
MLLSFILFEFSGINFFSSSHRLRQLSNHLRACGNAYVGAADLCWLYGHTRHWCTPGKQPMVLSKNVPLREDEMAGTPVRTPDKPLTPFLSSEIAT